MTAFSWTTCTLTGPGQRSGASSRAANAAARWPRWAGCATGHVWLSPRAGCGRIRFFRDAVHHFLRRFDQTFARFESHASDQDIAALSDTRTARAFMLLGRVTGTFD